MESDHDQPDCIRSNLGICPDSVALHVILHCPFWLASSLYGQGFLSLFTQLISIAWSFFSHCRSYCIVLPVIWFSAFISITVCENYIQWECKLQILRSTYIFEYKVYCGLFSYASHQQIQLHPTKRVIVIEFYKQEINIMWHFGHKIAKCSFYFYCRRNDPEEASVNL